MHDIPLQSSHATSPEVPNRISGKSHMPPASDRPDIEAARIRDALGRPVMRTVRDREGRVILNPGDLILHASIERARASRVLDRLLESAYRSSARR
ncbi:MAG: hypothetical protein AAFX40_11760 [Cyanobacteria bacterium J06639_1]